MKRILISLLLILLLALTIISVGAQDDSETPIEFSGTIEVIGDTTMTVSGVTVDISTLDSAVIAVLESGMEITVSGSLDGTVVIAVIIVLPDDPEATDAPDDDDGQGEDDDETGISVQIFISVDDGTTWVSSDSDVEADAGDDVLVRFVVLNLSDSPFTAIDLSDTSIDISLCEIPDSLPSGEDFDCTVTITLEGDFDSLALVIVVAGELDGVIITISEDVDISEDDDDDGDEGIVIVIEGPVTEIDGTTIIIFGFDIVLAEDDLRLTVIQIGDVLRIEGDWDDDNPVILAFIIIFIDVDVFIFEGVIWRDPGDCAGAPPPWAPAHGWRRRCETSDGGGSGGGGRRGSGRGSS